MKRKRHKKDRAYKTLPAASRKVNRAPNEPLAEHSTAPTLSASPGQVLGRGAEPQGCLWTHSQQQQLKAYSSAFAMSCWFLLFFPPHVRDVSFTATEVNWFLTYLLLCAYYSFPENFGLVNLIKRYKHNNSSSNYRRLDLKSLESQTRVLPFLVLYSH